MDTPQDITGPELIELSDGMLFRYEVDGGDLDIEMSGSLLATHPDTLDTRTAEAIRTHGRSEIERALADSRGWPVAKILVTSHRVPRVWLRAHAHWVS